MTEGAVLPSKTADLTSLFREIEVDPRSSELWEKVVKLASSEEEREHTEASVKLPVLEIIKFGEQLRGVLSEKEKYQLLTKKTVGGELWYDIILGEGNRAMFQPIAEELEEVSTGESKRWNNSLDIGTGTGDCVNTLTRYSESVSGIDVNEDMLKAARSKFREGAVNFVMAEAGKIPFEDETFDLIVSNGLTVYLSREETKQLAEEIFRVMVPGGEYMETILQRVPDRKMNNARELLIDYLGGLAIDRDNHDSPTISEQIKLFQQAGLIPDPQAYFKERNQPEYAVLRFIKAQ